MLATLRTLLVLIPLFSALLWLLADFNVYVTIDRRVYVESRPPPLLRIVYSLGLGVPASLFTAASFTMIGGSRSGRRVIGFLVLATSSTAMLFFFADLNMYVVGHGPDGQDWLKNGSPWDVIRLLECAALSMVPASLSMLVLCGISEKQMRPNAGGGLPSLDMAPEAAKH